MKTLLNNMKLYLVVISIATRMLDWITKGTGWSVNAINRDWPTFAVLDGYSDCSPRYLAFVQYTTSYPVVDDCNYAFCSRVWLLVGFIRRYNSKVFVLLSKLLFRSD